MVTVDPIESISELAAALEHWRGCKPTLVSIAVESDVVDGDADDPRLGDLQSLVVVIHERTWIVRGAAIGGLDEVVKWWCEFDAPGVLTHDAHAACARISRALGYVPELRIHCTKIAAVLLSEGTRNDDPPSFEECHFKILGERLPPKPTGLTIARRIGPIFVKMVELLRKRSLVAVYQLECDLVAAVVEMEEVGVPCDGAAFTKIAESWKAERAQVKDPDRIASLDKLLSSYAEWPRFFVRNDRIHSRIHPLAASTGRFSITEPALQQVPTEHTAPGLRATFRPKPPSILVVADYAQIELRVAAHIAQCDALTQIFVEGKDPHRATAATLTGRPEAEVTERERKLAKAVNFGFLFGMGAPRFKEYAAASYGLTISDAEARDARDAFFTTFPGIARWHDRVRKYSHGDSIAVCTGLGRRCRLYRADGSMFNVALSIPVQGTAADGFKIAMIQIRPRLAELGGRGVLVVHDEYIAEVPAARAESARRMIQRVMVSSMERVVPCVPIVVDARVSTSWSESDDQAAELDAVR